MRSMVLPLFGGPELFEKRDLPQPEPGPGEVLVRELGADVAIDYRAEDAAAVALSDTNGIGVDAAFDIEGEDLVARCLPAIRPFGRFACILPPRGDLALLYQRNITLHGVFLTRERARLNEMRSLFERGQARPLIDWNPLGERRSRALV